MAFELKLDRLELVNFRQFERYTVDFDEHLTVLVGNNGSGKSSVLAAACVALGKFASLFAPKSTQPILSSDARVVFFDMDGMIDRQEQYPVVVSAKGRIGENAEPIVWSCSRDSHDDNGNGALNLKTDPMANSSLDCLKRVQNGDADLVLPIVACYGTNRLWARLSASSSAHQHKTFSRQDGYDGAFDASANGDQMIAWFYKMTAEDVQRAQSLRKAPASPLYMAVRGAVERCFQLISGSERVNVTYSFSTDDLDVEYFDKSGEIHRESLGQLSDGYRTTLSMVADIAYRMALLNPALGKRVLETPGVVLVDEIDLHLHPLWQARILGDLAEIFPNVQFIVTTHAPVVISSVHARHIRLLNGGERAVTPGGEIYGSDAGRVLTSIMGAPERQQDVQYLFDEFYRVLDEGDFKEAQRLLDELAERIGTDDTEFVGAQTSLSLEEAEAAYDAD